MTITKTERRFEIIHVKKKWRERSFKEKLYFWKDFEVGKFNEIPSWNPNYEEAPFFEVEIKGPSWCRGDIERIKCEK